MPKFTKAHISKLLIEAGRSAIKLDRQNEHEMITYLFALLAQRMMKDDGAEFFNYLLSQGDKEIKRRHVYREIGTYAVEQKLEESEDSEDMDADVIVNSLIQKFLNQ